MDQSKIGAFISDCRKRVGLTQEQLAERLNITGKAVSKWENGKSMPDVALLVPLSEALGVSLNELMAGEVIADARVREQSDAVLLQVLRGRREKARVGAANWLLLCIGLVLLCAPLFGDFGKIMGPCIFLVGFVAIGAVIARVQFAGR